jgi:excisionase family DNA binding protein
MSKPAKEAQGYDVKVLLLKNRLVTEEAACLLGVSPRTVRRYMQEGKIEFQRMLVGGKRTLLTETVKKHIP